ncbi:MAG: DUF2946 family protein [Sphingomonas sp.]
MTVGGQPIARRKRDGTRQLRGRSGGASAHRPWLSPRLRGGWLATLVAVLVAFSWQSFVTQTHRHFDPGAISGVAAAKADVANPQAPGRQAPPDLPANCPICRELAHAGPFVLPAPITFDAPAPAIFWLALATLPGLTLTQRSHAWQSRAPPQPLQA